MRIQLDKVIYEGKSKVAMVVKFREIITKMMDDESSAVLYPYSTSSRTIIITAIKRMSNKFTDLKRYIPNLKYPVKDINVLYGQIYIGTNTAFNGLKTNFLEWTKANGHGLYLKFVQDEQTTIVGYRLYTQKKSNTPCYQSILSTKLGIPIAIRFRKISSQKIGREQPFIWNTHGIITLKLRNSYESIARKVQSYHF